jgi:hypothetical protein
VEGVIATENPVSDVLVAGGPKKFKAPYYAIPEIVSLGEAAGDHPTAFGDWRRLRRASGLRTSVRV